MLMEKIKLVLAFLRIWPLLLFYKWSPNKVVINADIDRWNKELRPESTVSWHSLCWLLSFQPSFRNLFYFRIRPLPRLVKRLLCPLDPNFFITDEMKSIFSDFEGGGDLCSSRFWDAYSRTIGGCRVYV